MRVELGFAWFYQVLLSFTGFYWLLLAFTEFFWLLLAFTGFYWLLLAFTGIYQFLPGFTGFYQVLLTPTWSISLVEVKKSFRWKTHKRDQRHEMFPQPFLKYFIGFSISLGQ